jgi:ERCC4-related helicase
MATSGDGLHCKCGHRICDLGSVCRFSDAKHKHLITTGEVACVRKLPRKPNPYLQHELSCTGCGQKIGSITRVGLLDTPVACLKSEAVKLVYQGRDYQPAGIREAHGYEFLRQQHAAEGGPQEASSSTGTASSSPPGVEVAALTASGPSPWALVTKQPRPYQLEAACFAAPSRDPTVVCMPTGCGKTLVAALLAQHSRKLNPQLSVAFLAPTHLLVDQQGDALLQLCSGLREDELRRAYGAMHMSHKQRQGLISSPPPVLLSAPGYFEGLLQDGLRPEAFSLLVLDEAHHAAGTKHPYRQILLALLNAPPERRPCVLGLTASPAAAGLTGRAGAGKLLDSLERLKQACGPGARLFTPVEHQGDLLQHTQLADTEVVRVEPGPKEQQLLDSLETAVLACLPVLRQAVEAAAAPELQDSSSRISKLMMLLDGCNELHLTLPGHLKALQQELKRRSKEDREAAASQEALRLVQLASGLSSIATAAQQRGWHPTCSAALEFLERCQAGAAVSGAEAAVAALQGGLRALLASAPAAGAGRSQQQLSSRMQALQQLLLAKVRSSENLYRLQVIVLVDTQQGAVEVQQALCADAELAAALCPSLLLG